MAEPNRLVLIMAGGKGPRFWPCSTSEKPKQYVNLVGESSLLKTTINRVKGVVAEDSIYICSAKGQEAPLQKEFPHPERIIWEPQGRNTSPCLMLSLAYFLRKGFSKDTVMVVLASDHFVKNEALFRKILGQACEMALETKGLITLGIKPEFPHTGYGYIEVGNSFKVERFVEKPSLEKAKEFLDRGTFYWNAGIFVWTLGALEKAFAQFSPRDWDAIKNAETAEILEKTYAKVEATPIDVAVMEKSKEVYLLPCDVGWNDVGSWNAVYELLVKEKNSNVAKSGDVRAVESTGCLVQVKPGRKVALVGVNDLVVVEGEDGTLLIVPRSKDQLVKEAAKKFE